MVTLIGGLNFLYLMGIPMTMNCLLLHKIHSIFIRVLGWDIHLYCVGIQSQPELQSQIAVPVPQGHAKNYTLF